MTEPPQPDFGTGDPVGWHASRRHGAGTGIVTEVIPGAPTKYVVHKLVDGRPTGQTLTVAENLVYPTRSLTDTRPQPGPHRRAPP